MIFQLSLEVRKHSQKLWYLLMVVVRHNDGALEVVTNEPNNQRNIINAVKV